MTSIKTTIPTEAPDGTPNAGARQPKGKSSECDAVLLGHDPGSRKAVAVKSAVEDKGAARRAIDTQVGQNGNPKKRDASGWGTGHSAAENEKELK